MLKSSKNVLIAQHSGNKTNPSCFNSRACLKLPASDSNNGMSDNALTDSWLQCRLKQPAAGNYWHIAEHCHPSRHPAKQAPMSHVPHREAPWCRAGRAASQSCNTARSLLQTRLFCTLLDQPREAEGSISRHGDGL